MFCDIHDAFLHDIAYLKSQQADRAAENQCSQVADLIEKYHLPQIRIETNGIGKFLPELLKKTLQEMHIISLQHGLDRTDVRLLVDVDEEVGIRVQRLHQSFQLGCICMG